MTPAGRTVFHVPRVSDAPHRDKILPLQRGDWVDLGKEGGGWVVGLNWDLTKRTAPVLHVLLTDQRPMRSPVR